MKKICCAILLTVITVSGFFQIPEKIYPENQLTTVGAYYFPEHWDESQWERDIQKMAVIGFEFTHFGEFARPHYC